MAHPAARRRLVQVLPLILGHAGLAVVGLVLWSIDLADDQTPDASPSSSSLAVALPRSPARSRRLSGGGPRHVEADTHPENNFPLPVVAAHGLFAAATLVLVLLAAFVS